MKPMIGSYYVSYYRSRI